MGQSLATTFAQLAVDVFQVPIDKIRIAMGDTDRVTGFGSAGSRSLFVVGSAVKVAAERTVEAATKLAAHELEAADADIEYGCGVSGARHARSGSDSTIATGVSGVSPWRMRAKVSAPFCSQSPSVVRRANNSQRSLHSPSE